MAALPFEVNKALLDSELKYAPADGYVDYGFFSPRK
jgi:hypothetical protein